MSIDLKNQKCQACSGNTPKFDEKNCDYFGKADLQPRASTSEDPRARKAEIWTKTISKLSF